MVFFVPGPVTSSQLNSIVTRIVRRDDDQPYTSNTTLTADDTLSFSVEANTMYRVAFWLMVTGGSTGDLKTQWSVPSGSVVRVRWCLGPDATTGASDPAVLGAVRLTGSLPSSNVVYALNSTTNFAAILETAIVEVGATSGNVVIQHAQNATDATATTIRAGSWAECVQIVGA